MSDISLQDIVNHMISNSLKISMKDETWQRLGFKKRPRYGEIFQRFRKKWKVDLEKELLTELIVIYLSYGVRSYSESFDVQKMLNEINLQLDENYSGFSIWKGLGFSSNESFLDYVIDGIKVYYKLENDKWLTNIASRTGFKEIPDKEIQSELFVGLAYLTSALPNKKIIV